MYYVLAVVCATAFFVHEFVPVNSLEFVNIVKEHSSSKAERSNTRKAVLDSQKGTELYEKYYLAKTKTDELWADVLVMKEKEKFLNFKTFQQFLGEFGWSFGLFIYSLFNIIMVRLRNGESKSGETALHSTLLFISIYFINWATLPSDYSKITYVIFTVSMCVLIVSSVYFLLRSKRKYIDHLKNTIRSFFHFFYKDADENDLINPNKRIEFRKIRMELTDKAVGNE